MENTFGGGVIFAGGLLEDNYSEESGNDVSHHNFMILQNPISRSQPDEGERYTATVRDSNGILLRKEFYVYQYGLRKDGKPRKRGQWVLDEVVEAKDLEEIIE